MSTNLDLEIVDLVEAAVIADLQLDSEIAPYIRERDSQELKGGDDVEDPAIDEQLFTVTVAAEDRGDFENYPGISIVGVNIEIQRNFAEEDPQGLAKLAARIAARLPATHLADQSRHQAFCNSRLHVMGIMATETEKRSDQNLSRERTVARQFVCTQIA